MSSPTATHISSSSPNAHPYAIKTSSSAVLTRSNSVGHRDITSHHYTPPSPSKPAPAVTQSRYVPSSHRHTRSMSSTNDDIFAKPPPVPLPASPPVLVGLANKTFGDSAVSDGEGIPPTPPMTWRIKRSETLPSVFPSSKSDSEITVDDLPKNPKIWTPAQLSVYLSSSLRLKGGVKLPLPIMRDIAAFVIKEHLSGRTFLRMKADDYDNLGINQLWKDTLLDASRALRQNLVQGRIMGFGSSPLSPQSMEGMLEQDDEDLPAIDLPSIDLPDLPAYSTTVTRRRGVPRQWDEDKKRMSKTTFRAGRVRGMVETYERSFSESSASGSDDDDDRIPRGARIGGGNGNVVVDEPEPEPEPEQEPEQEQEDAGFASGELTSGSENEPGVLDSPSPLVETIEPIEDDSPSIETLLREQDQNGVQLPQARAQAWGAKAWEDEIDNPHDIHVTAKRVPLIAPATTTTTAATAPSPGPSPTWQNTMPHPSGDNPRASLVGIFEVPRSMRDVSVGADHDGPSLRVDADADMGGTPNLDAGEMTAELDADGTQSLDVYETIEALRKRLDIVEERLGELERKEAERSRTVEQQRSQEAEPDRTPASTSAVYLPKLPYPFDVLYPSAAERRHRKNYSDADPSVFGLPRYMFLISLGVAAVVTRVMLRRVLGDKKRK